MFSEARNSLIWLNVKTIWLFPSRLEYQLALNWHVDDCQEKVCASVSRKLLSQKLVGKLSAGAIRITSQIKIINSTDKLKYF